MIEFKDVYKSFNNHLVIKGESFIIDDSDFTLLVGHNGSGKSTTINLILGLLKLGKKDKGEVINTFTTVSYFPEKFVLPSLIKSHSFLYTYFENEKSKSEIEYFISRYQIPNKLICNLSKGMGQKVILVKTLMEESSLYIFDEPLNGLDDESRNLFKEDLKNLSQKEKAIIISTHEPEFFQDIATKLVRLGEMNE